MLDWNDLRTVLAVSRARGAGEAASALGVHPSTVFRRLNALEASLGVRLFDHLPEGYVPTAAGEEVCAVAERMEADIAVLDRRIAGRDLRPSGTVRVTTTDTLFGLLTPHFAAFRAAHPEIELHVVVANRFFDLTRHDADVAIRPTNDPPETLVGRRLATIATAIYGSEGYLASRPGAADLACHDWIGLDEALAHLAAARWLRRAYPHAAVRYRVNTLMAALEAARAGLGLAALPCYLADGESSLRRVTPPLGELDSALWILTHEDLRHVARVRAFLDAMAGRLAQAKGLLAGAA
jgi:DNA-binding transcriptional LysR family regulator